MLITKVEKLKLNNKTKLEDQLQKYMRKKEQEMLDMLVEKLLYLWVVVLPMVPKVKLIIKNES